MKDKYVLRDVDDDEIARLGFQHRVWKAETGLAIRKAQVQQGEVILDLGSGPGYLGFELAEMVGPTGSIYCVDTSEKFLKFIESREIPNVHTVQADIRARLSEIPELKGRAFDKVFCRWVLMFIDRVEEVIEQVYQLLGEGGKFISLEYFRFEQIDIFPHSAHFDHLYRNVKKLIINNGGNPDIGGEVHEIMRRKGFRRIQTYPIYRSGKAHSPLWKWLEMTNRNHTNLVASSLITEQQLAAYHQDWEHRSKEDIAFITAPPLMITIGQK